MIAAFPAGSAESAGVKASAAQAPGGSQSPPDSPGSILAALAKLPGGWPTNLLLLIIAAILATQPRMNDTSVSIEQKATSPERVDQLATRIGELEKLVGRVDTLEKADPEIKTELEQTRKAQSCLLAVMEAGAEWEEQALAAGFAGKSIPPRPSRAQIFRCQNLVPE